MIKNKISIFFSLFFLLLNLNTQVLADPIVGFGPIDDTTQIPITVDCADHQSNICLGDPKTYATNKTLTVAIEYCPDLYKKSMEIINQNNEPQTVYYCLEYGMNYLIGQKNIYGNNLNDILALLSTIQADTNKYSFNFEFSGANELERNIETYTYVNSFKPIFNCSVEAGLIYLQYFLKNQNAADDWFFISKSKYNQAYLCSPNNTHLYPHYSELYPHNITFYDANNQNVLSNSSFLTGLPVFIHNIQNTCLTHDPSFIAGKGCWTPIKRRQITATPSSCPTCNNELAPTAGDPVDVKTGYNIDTVQDVNFPISFKRNYSSARTENYPGTLGFGWRHEYEKKLSTKTATDPSTGQTFVTAVQIDLENDDSVIFTKESATSSFKPFFKNHNKFRINFANNLWILTDAIGVQYFFDANGLLKKIVNPGGYTLTLSYNGNLLSLIMDSYKRTLSFSYSSNANVITSVTSMSGKVLYTYNLGYLATREYQGVLGKKLTYIYEPVNNKLASKTNERGQVQATYEYGTGVDFDKVIKHKMYDGTNTYEYGFQYSDSQTTVTNGGATTTYGVQTLDSRAVLGSASTTSSDANLNLINQTHDSNSTFPSYTTSASGEQTISNYDTDGYLIRSCNKVCTDYTWDKTLNKISTIRRGNLTTTYAYNTNGQVSSKSVSNGSSTRTWLYSYTTFGRINGIVAPGGVNTSYTYYGEGLQVMTYTSTNQQPYYGMIKTISKTVGNKIHTITINSYNFNGNVASMTDEKGLLHTFSYDSYGNMSNHEIKNGSNVIGYNYSYDSDGNLLSYSDYSGYQINTSFDILNKPLVSTDNMNGTIQYHYDSKGNLSNKTELQESNIVGNYNAVYDSVNRIKQAWSKAGEVTSYNYEGVKLTGIHQPGDIDTSLYYNGSLLSNELTNNRYKSNQYDNLDRVVSNNINGVSYNYTYSDFDEITSSLSSNTGLDTYSYIPSSRITLKTDSAQVTHQFGYDELGRLLAHNAGSYHESHTYDVNLNGTVSTRINNNTQLTYSQNAFGLTTGKNQSVNINGTAISKMVSYGYSNPMQQLSTMTYPSGMMIQHQRTNGKITEIDANVASTNYVLIKNIKYLPMSSAINYWDWGYSSTNITNKYRNVQLNSAGEPVTITDGPLTINYQMEASNPSQIDIQNYFGNNTSHSFGYDIDSLGYGLNAYIENGNTKFISYGQDMSLTSKQDQSVNINPGSNDFTFQNNPGTNQISYSQKVNSFDNTTYQYDVKGNMISMTNSIDPTKNMTMAYNEVNNMTSLTKSGQTTQYIYNALGERVAKIRPDGTYTIFMYNESQQLIGEYTFSASGTQVDFSEFVYINNIMVALNKNNSIYYIHNDMTNTPRAITSVNSSSSQLIWGWTLSDPYGDNEATGSIVFNPRFMGQYYDNESGLHYNYHRYYSPKLGRYIQSDPIGIAGGWNTYNYVENHPLTDVDPLGLFGENGFFTFTTFESAKRIPLEEAVRRGEDTRNITLPAISGALYGGIGGSMALGYNSYLAYTECPVLTTVSRWGRPGLQEGDWVIPGGANFFNYVRSGKYQPQFLPGNNIPAKFNQGEEFVVPTRTLEFPKGRGIDGSVKRITGQKRYQP
jgi:RHS repeat-associated protein